MVGGVKPIGKIDRNSREYLDRGRQVLRDRIVTVCEAPGGPRLHVVDPGSMRKSVSLHGWVYKIETGEVFAYDLASQTFKTVADEPAVPQGVPASIDDAVSERHAVAPTPVAARVG